jgi:hypothetical protein
MTSVCSILVSVFENRAPRKGTSLSPGMPFRDFRSSSLRSPARRLVSPSLSRMMFFTSRVAMMGISAIPVPARDVILISSSRVTSFS